MNIIEVGIEEFLRPFFNPSENVCMRVFSDKKNDGFKGQKFDFNVDKIESYVPILKEHNAKNRGIFFAVNYGGHEDKEIKRINAQLRHRQL